MQPGYSPHQVAAGGVVNSEYPMGSQPPVPQGAIPPHLQGDAYSNGAQWTMNGQPGALADANAAVDAAMVGKGQGIFDVPKYNDGGPGMSGS